MTDSPIRFPGLFGDWAFTASGVAFHIGGKAIYWYGIIIALGVVLALWFCMTQREKYGITEDDLLDAVLWGVPLAIVGARLYSQGLINGSFGTSYDILPGAAYVYAGGDSKDPHAVAQAILDEAKRLTEEGLDEAYYRRIINANFGAAMRALNSFESIAVSMVEGCFRRYDAYRFPEVYDGITQQDVLDFIRDSFTERGMALSIVYPKEG